MSKTATPAESQRFASKTATPGSEQFASKTSTLDGSQRFASKYHRDYYAISVVRESSTLARRVAFEQNNASKRTKRASARPRAPAPCTHQTNEIIAKQTYEESKQEASALVDAQ